MKKEKLHPEPQCKTCRYSKLEWYESPCDMCTVGGVNSYYTPSAQLEQTCCEYCHEDSDGYVRPIEKNSHAWLIRHGRITKLRIGFKGEYRECDILFCPMCGRRLTDG